MAQCHQELHDIQEEYKRAEEKAGGELSEGLHAYYENREATIIRKMQRLQELQEKK